MALGNAKGGAGDRVMAVLVLYGRELQSATPWPTLLAWLTHEHSTSLRQCLIYDNSPACMVGPGELPDGAHLRWEPANRGTAGAYAAAAAIAAQHRFNWLLLLDQDTVLPRNYLTLIDQAITATPNAAVLVPRVRHGTDIVSPAKMTYAGSIRPCANPSGRAGMTTAISTGVAIQRELMTEIDFPPAIWLDYVDHWMFLEVAKRGMTIGSIEAELTHDLSVRRPATLSDTRVRSILAAEAAYYGELGFAARAVLPFRRLARAVRYALAGRPALARLVLAKLVSTAQRP